MVFIVYAWRYALLTLMVYGASVMAMVALGWYLIR